MTTRKHSDLLTTIEFAREVDRAIREYNAKLHRGIKVSPIAAWRANEEPVVQVAESNVALALLRRDRVHVSLDGRVEVNTVEYVGKGSLGHRGEDIEAGWLATHPEFIDLFEPSGNGIGTYLGRCTPLDEASGKLAGLAERIRDREITTVRDAEKRAKEIREELRLPGLAVSTTEGRRSRKPGSRAAGTSSEPSRRRRVAAMFKPEAKEQ